MPLLTRTCTYLCVSVLVSCCSVTQANDPCPQSLLSPAQTAAGRHQGGAPRESHPASARCVISDTPFAPLSLSHRAGVASPQGTGTHPAIYCCSTFAKSRHFASHARISVNVQPKSYRYPRALSLSLMQATSWATSCLRPALAPRSSRSTWACTDSRPSPLRRSRPWSCPT